MKQNMLINTNSNGRAVSQGISPSKPAMQNAFDLCVRKTRRNIKDLAD